MSDAQGGKPPEGGYGQPPYGAPAGPSGPAGPAGYGGYPPPGYPPAGYPPPGYGYGPPRRTDSNAVVALVLAIVSWVLCPVVPAIVALVVAGSADRSIAASGGMLEGEGLVKAARIISWINIIFYVVAGVIAVIALTLAVSAGSTSSSY